MGLLSGLGRGIQQGAQTYLALTEAQKQRERQERLDSRQSEMDEIQRQLTSAQMRNMEADNARAEAEADRLRRKDEREAVTDILTNLDKPTKVDDATKQRIMDAGLGAYLEGEKVPVPGMFGGAPMGLEVETGSTIAKPFVTPAMKNAQETTERTLAGIEATNARSAASLEARLAEIENRSRYNNDMLDIRRQLADLSQQRFTAGQGMEAGRLRQAFEALVEKEADSMFPVTQVEQITGVIDPDKLQSRNAYKAKRLTELGFSGPAMPNGTELHVPSRSEVSRNSVLPPNLRTGSAPVDPRVAAAAAAIRNR